MVIHQQKAGYRQGERNNDMIDVPQEKDRQDRIDDKKEFDARIDPQGINQRCSNRVQGKIQQPRHLVFLSMVQKKYRNTDHRRKTTGDPDGRWGTFKVADHPRNRDKNTGEQTDNIQEIENTQLSFFNSAKRRPVTDIPDVSPKEGNTFDSLIHGQGCY